MDGGIEVGVVGERRLVLEAIAAALGTVPGVVAKWCDGRRAADVPADVWLVDGGAGVEARVARLRDAVGGGAPVVLLTQGGPAATVTEEIGPEVGLDDLVARLEEVTRVGAHPVPARACPLSARELTVISALAGGMSQDAIGTALGVSSHTVRTHIQHAMAKLGVHSRQRAIEAARDAGWLHRGPPSSNGADQ